MAIGEAIHVAVTPEEETLITTAKEVNPEAYEAYLLGKFFHAKRTPDGFEKAAESFQRAIELDPNFAEAHVGLGMAYWVPSSYGFVPEAPALARARPHIDTALALDDTLAVAHVAAGYIARSSDWDLTRAEREFLRAIELNPGDPAGHAALSGAYPRLGRFDDAIRESQEAINLDPLNLLYSSSLADNYLAAGRYEEAIAQRQKVFELDPVFLPALRNVSINYRVISRYNDAIEVMDLAIDNYGRLPQLLGYLLVAHADAGNKDEAEALLTELHARAQDEYVGATSFALAYAALGDMDEAFRWLDQAIEDRDNLLSNPYWPVWIPFRDDPRFIDMLRRINYPAIEAFEAALQNAASAETTQNPVD